MALSPYADSRGVGGESRGLGGYRGRGATEKMGEGRCGREGLYGVREGDNQIPDEVMLQSVAAPMLQHLARPGCLFHTIRGNSI